MVRAILDTDRRAIKAVLIITALALSNVRATSGAVQAGPATDIPCEITEPLALTAAQSPWVATCVVKVIEGGALTVESGATVEFAGDAGLTVDGGSLIVNGTAPDQVLFTSNKAVKAAGDWRGVKIDQQGTGELRGLTIRYAGQAGQPALALESMIVTSTLANNTVTDAVIEDTDAAGIRVNQVSAVVRNVTVHRSNGAGIEVTEAREGLSSVELAGVTLERNDDAVTSGTNVQFVLSGNSARDNATNGIVLSGGAMQYDITWPGGDLPFVLRSAVSVESDLTIEPGTVVKAEEARGLNIRTGSLTANGTADGKIYFTTITDDEACTSSQVDCDTKSDGRSVPLPGSWSRLEFKEESSGGSISNAELRYGRDGMLRVDTPTVVVSQTLFTQSDGDAVEVSDHSLSIVNSRFVSNADSGVFMRTRWPVTLTLRNNIFENNGIESGAAIVVMDAETTLLNEGNEAPGFTNGINGYQVSGNMTVPHTWLASDLPYVIDGTIDLQERAAVLTVQAGSVVKLGDRAAIRATRGEIRAGTVDGAKVLVTSLKDDACSADIDAGCDTNGDGGGTIPQEGDWGKIEIKRTSGGAFLRQTVVRYGGTTSCTSTMIDLSHADSSIEHSEIAFSGGAGILVTQVPTLLANNTIHDNKGHGVQLRAGTTPQLVTLRDNEFTDNGVGCDGAAIDMDANAELVLEGNNEASGNVKNGVAVHGDSRVTHRWRAGNLPYIVVATVDVDDQSTLTIEPGAVVKLDDDADITTQRGTLIAEGTADAPIVFTSIRDDTVGGDANPREGDVNPNAGNWGSIRFDDTGGGGRLIHVKILYAGAGFSPGLIIERGDISVKDTLIRYGGGGGILLDNVNTEITDSTIHEQRGPGIRINADKRAVEPVIHGNTFIGNQSAIEMDADAQPDLADNSATDNTLNGVLVSGTVTIERHWVPGDLIYVLGQRVTIAAGARLQLGAGTIVKAQPDAELDSGRGSLYVPTEGSGDEPVIFTSVRDDSLCDAQGTCDTNGDATSSAAAPGDWKGLSLSSNSRIVLLNNMGVYYAGADKAAVVVETNGTRIENSDVAYSLLDGIDVEGARADIINNTIRDNYETGLNLEGDAVVNVQGNVFTGNQRSMAHRARGAVDTADNVAIGNVHDAMLFCADVRASQVWHNDLAREIACGVDVENGADLTIDPGTVLLFAGGRGIDVKDRLYAEGVAFAATEPNPDPGFWRNIAFGPTSGGHLRHNIFLFGGTSSSGIVDIENQRNMQVSYNTLLRANGSGVSVRQGGSATIHGNIIRQVEGRNASGIRIDGEATADIKNNRITNTDVGVYLRRAASTLSLRNSNLAGTVSFGVKNDGNTCADARWNWWGDRSGPFDDSSRDDECKPSIGELVNIDGKGEPVSDDVNYLDWWTTPPPVAPLVDSPRCGVTSQRSVPVSGSTTANATVNIYDGESENPIRTVVAGGDGRFETDLTLSSGEHRLSFDAGTGDIKSARTGFRVIEVEPNLTVDPSGVYFEYGPVTSARRQPVRNEAGCATGCGGPSSGRVTLPPGEEVVVGVPITGSATSVQFVQPGRPAVPLASGAGGVWTSAPFEPVQGPFTIEVDGATPLACMGYVYPGGDGFVFADLGVKHSPVFSHDFEEGDQGWIGEPPWRRTEDDAHSGRFSWTDSPGKQPNGKGLPYRPRQELALSYTRYINLRGVSAPTLRFWHSYRFAGGDHGYVEGRAGSSGSWERLADYTGVTIGWESVAIPLDDYAREPRFYLRFVLKSDRKDEDDGWYIDDVSVGPGGGLNKRYDVGEPLVANAKVRLLQRNLDTGVWDEWWGYPTNQVNPQWTDSAGRYGFFNLPPGEYQLIVEPGPGSYGPYRSPVLVVWNGTMAFNAPLTGSKPMYLPWTGKQGHMR